MSKKQLLKLSGVSEVTRVGGGWESSPFNIYESVDITRKTPTEVAKEIERILSLRWDSQKMEYEL